MSRGAVFAFFAFLCVTFPAHAAKIYVSVTAPDSVGKQLAYELREKIASSSRNELVFDEDKALFKILVVTLDSEHTGQSTIYSVVLNFGQFDSDNSLDYYLASWVGVCGSSKTPICAANLASEIDSEMQPVIETILKGLKQDNQSPTKKKDGSTF